MLLTKSPFFLNITVVKSNGQRLSVASLNNIYVTSGDYRKQFCHVELPKVSAGQYTVVLSTFEPHQTGDFVLRIGSFEPVAINAV
jgi:calpain-7